MPSERGATPWLLVSKPLRPPFRDGSTVMVRHLVEGLSPSFPLAYFGDPEHPVRQADGDRVIRAPAMSYSPRMTDKARILATIASPRHARLPLHFFFTPNRVTSSVLASLRRLQPRRRFVQSITASDGIARHAGLLHSLDAVVVASEHGKTQLVSAGFPDARLHVIPPGTPRVELAGSRNPSNFKRLLYAGDLDAAVADRLAAIARGLAATDSSPGWRLTVASRPKGDEHAAARARLEELQTEVGDSMELLGEVDDMDALLRRVSLQLFVADHVRRKVDLPLVLLEGMARGVGLASLDIAPVREIFTTASEHGLDVGVRQSPERFEEFVTELLDALSNPTRIDAFGRDAHLAVERVYCVDQMVNNHEKLYEVLESHHANDVR